MSYDPFTGKALGGVDIAEHRDGIERNAEKDSRYFAAHDEERSKAIRQIIRDAEAAIKDWPAASLVTYLAAALYDARRKQVTP